MVENYEKNNLSDLIVNRQQFLKNILNVIP